MIGIWQLVLIFAIILVLYGAGRIPKIMKDLGSGLRAFKKGIEGAETNEEINLDELSGKKARNNKTTKSKKIDDKNKKSTQKKSSSKDKKKKVSGIKKKITKKNNN